MNKKNKTRAVEAGVGVAAAAAVAMAAAYLLSGKEGARRKAKMKAWAVKAQKEVVKNVKVARKLSESEYNKIVDRAVKQYGSLENVSAADVIATAKMLKAEWDRIQGIAKQMGKPAAKPKAVRKSSKKKAAPRKKAVTKKLRRK